MNKPVFYIIFLLFSFNTKAQQNLVPNGSFEEYWQCPQGNDLNNGQFERCKYWWKPTMGTSDYYNACNTGIVGVPNNFWGYQNAFHGNAYVGFGAISWDKLSSEVLGQEYIQTKLKEPLLPCSRYYFSMYVSCANDSQYGVGRIGGSFTKDSINHQTEAVLYTTPQIVSSQLPITDTSNWIKIDGTFVSSGDELFLTIGYFFDEFSFDTTLIQTNPLTSDFASYYFVDSVELYLVEQLTDCEFYIPNIFTPNNDGNNDFWEFNVPIEGELFILNRWGQTIYHSVGKTFSWDGGGSIEGVYFYKFITEKNIKTGFIQLIR